MQFNQCQPFEPHKPRVIYAEFDMDSPLQFPPHLRLDDSLSETWEVGLVVNQSVWIQWSGVYTQRPELFIRWLFLRLYLLYYVHYVIKHCYLISPLICSYMWDLILKTHNRYKKLLLLIMHVNRILVKKLFRSLLSAPIVWQLRKRRWTKDPGNNDVALVP